jgi:LuxR family transcriptional regulator, maltose regulon positive regulatory protein
MPAPILATKLYIPPPRPKIVPRPRLIERLNEGLSSGCKLTLISAAAGFGKTTLVSEWIASYGRPVAWLSLDERDNDPVRFISYLVSALQTIEHGMGEGLLAALQSPQPPSTESILTTLINEIAAIPDNFILVLDDYHLIEGKQVDQATAFLVEHQPPQMHLVVSTREDPSLPLARLRVRGQLNELRTSDLQFTISEASQFLNQAMGLNLSDVDIIALEARNEGWIAGLQLASLALQGLSMQGRPDSSKFIESFTGSHRFVLDYLMEEVLHLQSESIQTFLLCTSILNRMCGSLCDAVLGSPSASGEEPAGLETGSQKTGSQKPGSQETLEYLERANLFIIPLDNERHWYRYHHLFAELLQQRLQQSDSSLIDVGGSAAELHRRASQWFEDNGLELEAFQHATAANDIERTSRLIQGKGMPLHVRGGLTPVLSWLETLPPTALDERPILWVMYAGALTTAGQTSGAEQKLQAAEAALQGAELDIETRDMLGRIANIRATLAFMQYQPDIAIVQANLALEYLRPDNLPVRNISTWALGAAYHQIGDRTAASRAFTEAISISQTIGHTFVNTLATLGLGRVQETENQLYLAAETYQRVLQLYGDYPLPNACEAYLGLARIYYERNDLDAAEQYGQQSFRLAQQFDRVIDRFIVSKVFLARLKLARGDVNGAAAMLAEAEQSVRQNNFLHSIPEVVAAHVLVLLKQGDVEAAAHLAHTHELASSQARVYLAQADPSTALAVLEPFRQHMEAKGWADELLKVMVIQSIALHAQGEKDKAVQLLMDALTLAEPEGYVRIFVDEGEAMRSLLEKLPRYPDHPLSGYVDKLLAAFTQAAAPKRAAPVSASIPPKSVRIESEDRPAKDMPVEPESQPKSMLVETLSERELEVLRLLRSELSGPEIAGQLIVSLNTLRTHTKNIFKKLGVNSRRAAVRRAQELDLF